MQTFLSQCSNSSCWYVNEWPMIHHFRNYMKSIYCCNTCVIKRFWLKVYCRLIILFSLCFINEILFNFYSWEILIKKRISWHRFDKKKIIYLLIRQKFNIRVAFSLMRTLVNVVFGAVTTKIHVLNFINIICFWLMSMFCFL